MSTNKIKLAYPITLGSGELLEEINLRRVTAGDHRKAAVRCKNDPVETEYAVMTMVSGLQQEDFDSLDLSDVRAIRKFLFGDED